MIRYFEKLEEYDISRKEFASCIPFLEEKKRTGTIKDYEAAVKCIANIITSFLPEGYTVSTRWRPDGVTMITPNEIYLHVFSPKGVKIFTKFKFLITADILFLKLELSIAKEYIVEGYLPTTLFDLKKFMPLIEDYALGDKDYNEMFGDLFEEYYTINEEA